MKRTLLDMVQNILGAMDSDEVNSIGDTIESLQVAEVIKETYEELFLNRDLPEHRELVQLEALSDVDRPNYLKIPENIRHIHWLRYDNRGLGVIDVGELDSDYRDVYHMEPDEFFDYVTKIAGQDNVVEVEDFSGARLYIKTNKHPTYWTTFDDTHIVFDSFNNDVDSSLQASKSITWSSIIPEWEMTDDFIPDLDANLFPLLLAEAKASCFINFKQVSNAKSEQQSRRQLTRSQKFLWKARQKVPNSRGPDYGRKTRF